MSYNARHATLAAALLGQNPAVKEGDESSERRACRKKSLNTPRSRACPKTNSRKRWSSAAVRKRQSIVISCQVHKRLLCCYREIAIHIGVCQMLLQSELLFCRVNLKSHAASSSDFLSTQRRQIPGFRSVLSFYHHRFMYTVGIYSINGGARVLI